MDDMDDLWGMMFWVREGSIYLRSGGDWVIIIPIVPKHYYLLCSARFSDRHKVSFIRSA